MANSLSQAENERIFACSISIKWQKNNRKMKYSEHFYLRREK
jgi:hypothetical protein